MCFCRLRSAHRVCKDGEHQWKTHTLTSSHFPMIPQRPGSASTVRKREKCQSPLDFSCFVFLDGHGGSIVAKYASKHLHKFIIQRPEYPSDIPAALKQVSFTMIIKRSHLTFRPKTFRSDIFSFDSCFFSFLSDFLQGFLECDTAMYNDEAIKEQMAGTTAVTILIKDGKLYCANAGDSRAIGSRNGSLVTLSNDHKPNNPEEMERIYNAGGWVEFNRVNGNLALSRALGDFLFKRNQTVPAEQQIVTGDIISNCNQRERASRRFSQSNSHKKNVYMLFCDKSKAISSSSPKFNHRLF